ncbi:ABC transporter permease [Paludibaculum fermentans]|uniref:ABC transporter permease n=1 Tax=Paludibaculum fermentans TaxID=1473598 RepID=A0A7S7SM04_PALFE|nr:ABC transporter permease [Paludibaculum fermentans]QOY88585.1 ABC transporter permease [Paludibaculum fermentans]
MNWVLELLRRLRFRFQRSRFDQDLAEEMRLHQDLRAQELQGDGVAASEARLAARRKFGNEARIGEDSREAWSWIFLDRLQQDLRYGLRALASNPGFTITAVLSLALGIGANTAIFSIINAMMLRTLPVEDPQALVQLKMGGGGDDELNTPLWEQLRDHQQSFSGTLAYASERLSLGTPSDGRFAQGLWVSGDFFRVLGVPAMQGRAFTTDDDRWGGGTQGPVAVVSYRFARSHFAEGQQVVGQTIQLNRKPFVIVGVTPPWFTGLDLEQSYDVAIPIGCQPVFRAGATTEDEIHHWWLRIIGRVPAGRTLKEADERLQAITPDILKATTPPEQSARDQAEYRKAAFELRPAGLGFSATRTQYRTALYVLMGTVGLVLLIACANIANLLLARAAARQRELSVRIAIGASRLRIIRQLMTESLLLALMGAGGGFLFSLWGSRALIRMLSTSARVVDLDTSPDLRLLAFTIAVAGLTAVIFGLAPAIRGTRLGVHTALKEQDRGTLRGTQRMALGKALVAGQVALSLVLLAGAGMFVVSLRNLLNVDAGFDRNNVLLVGLNLQEAVPQARRAALYQEVLQRLESTPGVASVASSLFQPIGSSGWAQGVEPEGFTPKSRRDSLLFLNRVSPGFFRTFGTALLAGREFNERDTLTAPLGLIINETSARQFFGTTNAVGRTIRMNKPGSRTEKDSYEVVGVVKDTKYNRMDEAPRRIGYLALWQDPEPGTSIRLAIRSGSSIETLVPAVRAAILGVQRDAALEFSSFEARVNDSLLQPRLVAVLSSIFGALALLLAVVGLYGVTAYSVARRRGEIGIRIALGAQRGSVVWLVLRDVGALLLAGLLAGTLISLGAGKLVGTLLYGLKPGDPLVLSSAAILLCTVTALAAYVPARRAARIDPMTALREE